MGFVCVWLFIYLFLRASERDKEKGRNLFHMSCAYLTLSAVVRTLLRKDVGDMKG